MYAKALLPNFSWTLYQKRLTEVEKKARKEGRWEGRWKGGKEGGGGGRTPKEAGKGAMCGAYPTLLLSHPLPLTRTGCLHFSYTHSAHSQCDQRRLPGVQTFTLNHHCSFLSLIPSPLYSTHM